jgi:ABC-type multidrug transport system fused ATPase/permease subunit
VPRFVRLSVRPPNSWFFARRQELTLPLHPLHSYRPSGRVAPDDALGLAPHRGRRWPARGCVVFDNVFLKYGDAGPWVLRGVTLEVGAGESVGVVGRTGGA